MSSGLGIGTQHLQGGLGGLSAGPFGGGGSGNGASPAVSPFGGSPFDESPFGSGFDETSAWRLLQEQGPQGASQGGAQARGHWEGLQPQMHAMHQQPAQATQQGVQPQGQSIRPPKDGPGKHSSRFKALSVAVVSASQAQRDAIRDALRERVGGADPRTGQVRVVAPDQLEGVEADLVLVAASPAYVFPEDRIDTDGADAASAAAGIGTKSSGD